MTPLLLPHARKRYQPWSLRMTAALTAAVAKVTRAAACFLRQLEDDLLPSILVKPHFKQTDLESISN